MQGCLSTSLNNTTKLHVRTKMGGLNPKNIMHSRIHEKIVDLNRCFVPRLSIIDWIVGNLCHETVCSPEEFNVIIGGTDVVAVDSVGVHLLGYEPTDVQYIVRAGDAGLRGYCGCGGWIRKIETLSEIFTTSHIFMRLFCGKNIKYVNYTIFFISSI